MSYKFLNDISVKDLREICKTVGIENPENISKSDLISYLKNGFKKYNLPEPDLTQKEEKWKIEDKIGYEGKEGTVYNVKKGSKSYAMKKFKKDKSVNKIQLESDLQKIASKHNLSPKIYDVDLENKWIVMDKLDKNLFDILKENNGKLSSVYQKRMIEIFKNLDKFGVYHGDPNPLNFMEKNGELYIIDFGFGSKIDDKLCNKLKSKTPNLSYMPIGFLLKIKDVCDTKNYPEILKYINKEDRVKFGI
jgi:tRNA A-37 threonylcarbamoyl transferase component Bud32